MDSNRWRGKRGKKEREEDTAAEFFILQRSAGNHLY